MIRTLTIATMLALATPALAGELEGLSQDAAAGKHGFTEGVTAPAPVMLTVKPAATRDAHLRKIRAARELEARRAYQRRLNAWYIDRGFPELVEPVR
jgi:hypothetical protein